MWQCVQVILSFSVTNKFLWQVIKQHTTLLLRKVMNNVFYFFWLMTPAMHSTALLPGAFVLSSLSWPAVFLSMFRMMKWSYNAQLQSTRSNKNFVLLLKALGTDSASSSPFQTPRYSIDISNNPLFHKKSQITIKWVGKNDFTEEKNPERVGCACNDVSCSSNPDHQITNQNAFGEVA